MSFKNVGFEIDDEHLKLSSITNAVIERFQFVCDSRLMKTVTYNLYVL